MTDPDDELAARLARLFAATDPVPAQLVEAASASLSWRDPDAALAALLLDSAVAGEAAGVRAGGPGSGAAQPRLLSFTVDDVVIDVELTVHDRRVELIGQVSRAVAAAVAIRHPGGTWAGRTDALGRFRADDLPAGPLRLTWTPPEGHARPVHTPTFLA